MKRLLSLFLLWPLGAQAPFSIVSVDRQGLPPYEPETRIYRLNAGARDGLRVGEWLAVRRSGDRRPLGHLLVSAVEADGAGAAFFPSNKGWPMKGDEVWRDPLPALPPDAAMVEPPLGSLAAPKDSVAAPPQEGVIFFLPQRADVSPAGLAKVSAWVESWGVAGKWLIQVPTRKTLKPTLQKQRAEALQAALKACGVALVEVQYLARTQEGPYDPSWIIHWD